MTQPLFKRSSTSIWHFSFFVLLSSLLMFWDYQGSYYTEKLRSILSFATEPLRLFVDAPFDLAHRLTVNLSSQENLLSQNKRLKKENEALLIRFQKWKALKQENFRLHALLGTVPQIDGKVSGAQIISMNLKGTRTLFLDKGRSEGVFIGQPVLDSHGFIGQVIRADWFNSVVLMVTDLKSAIPIEVVRTGEQGILSGTGSARTLQLNNLPKTAMIQKGDELVTSSLGGRFPAGYPIGHVRTVRKKSTDMFSQILVSPTAQIEQNRVVFLLWPGSKPHSKIASVPVDVFSKDVPS